MTAEEVICSAVLPRDCEQGIAMALQRLTREAERPAAESLSGQLQWLRGEVIAACIETAVHRFLRAHGIRHGPAPCEAIAGWRVLQVQNERVGLVHFALPAQHARADRIINALALVRREGNAAPWPQRHSVDRILFAFTAGEFSLTYQMSLRHTDDQEAFLQPANFQFRSKHFRVFLTAAPTVAECERRFRRLPQKTHCLQFPKGVPWRAVGCRIRELTAFSAVCTWGGV